MSQDGGPTPGLVLEVFLLEEIDRVVMLVLSPRGTLMTLLAEDVILHRAPEVIDE